MPIARSGACPPPMRSITLRLTASSLPRASAPPSLLHRRVAPPASASTSMGPMPPPPIALPTPLPLVRPSTAAAAVGCMSWDRLPPCPNGSSTSSSPTMYPSAGLGGSSISERAAALRAAMPASSAAPLPLASCTGPAAPTLLTTGPPPRRATPLPVPMPFHLAAALSKTVVTLMLALGASPPPASFLLQGCQPLAMRFSACEPAGVGPVHGRMSLLALLLPQAPHWEQKANGASPVTMAMTCPFALHASALLCAMCPLHRSALCLALRVSALAHVPQHSHRQEPWLNAQ